MLCGSYVCSPSLCSRWIRLRLFLTRCFSRWHLFPGSRVYSHLNSFFLPRFLNKVSSPLFCFCLSKALHQILLVRFMTSGPFLLHASRLVVYLFRLSLIWYSLITTFGMHERRGPTCWHLMLFKLLLANLLQSLLLQSFVFLSLLCSFLLLLLLSRRDCSLKELRLVILDYSLLHYVILLASLDGRTNNLTIADPIAILV